MKITKSEFKELIKESINEAKAEKFNEAKMNAAIYVLASKLSDFGWVINDINKKNTRQYNEMKFVLELFNNTSNSSNVFDDVVRYFINNYYIISDNNNPLYGYTQLYNALVKASKELK